MSRELHGRQKGQALVIVALAIVVLVGFLALAIDGGNAYTQRRIMQNAADAAALAGAQALKDGGNVQAAIYEYAGHNGADDPANIAWSYTDEEEEHVGVVVTTAITFPTLFAGVVDVPSMSASSSAAAQLISVSSFDWPLFANNEHDPEAIHINGNNLKVEGNIHSNGGIRIDGNNHTIDGGTESMRRFHVNGNNNSFDLGSPVEVTDAGGYLINGDNNSYPEPTYTANPEPIPQYELQRDLGDYGPARPGWVPPEEWHYYSGDWSFNQNNKTLSGLYYVQGDITLNGNNLGGEATFVATGDIKLNGNHYDVTSYDGQVALYAGGEVEINGNNLDLAGTIYATDEIKLDGNHCCITTYDQELALFSDGDIDINGNNMDVLGIVYAPQGEVKINGNSLSNPINGGVIGDTIEMNGNNANVVSYNPDYFPTEERVRLVQ